MRIDGNGRLPPLPPAAGSNRRGTGTAFTLPSGASAREAAPTRGPAPLAGMEAMLAVQSVDDALSRRRRAVRRGNRLLDALDSMKLALLAGLNDAALIDQLSALAASREEASGDPGLDDVLSAIELRAAVEIAKRSRRPSR